LVKAGVKLNCFHSAWECLRRFAFFRTYNRRNHRKLLVIDDRVAYFGGMNIVDHTCETPGDSETRSPAAIGWRDLHVRLEGSAQTAVAESFAASWKRSLGKRRRPRESAISLRKQLAFDRLRKMGQPSPESNQRQAQDEWIRFFD